MLKKTRELLDSYWKGNNGILEIGILHLSHGKIGIFFLSFFFWTACEFFIFISLCRGVFRTLSNT